VVERLEGRPETRWTGPEVRVAWVLSETPGRLVLSARLTAEPEGRLLDLISISVETDPTVLALTAMRPPSSTRSVDVAAITLSAPLEAAPLDLALLDQERLLLLQSESLLLLRWDGSSLRQEGRQALAGPFSPMRHVAGVIAAVESDAAAWVLTNRSADAMLVSIEKGRLAARARADAVPWPGSSTGLRYQLGTDWLDGAVEGLGTGPFLRLLRGGPPLAVLPDGRLRTPQDEPLLLVGSTLTPLWPGLLAIAAAGPPSSRDALWIVEREGYRLAESIPFEGTIVALASRIDQESARVVIGLRDADGSGRLAVVDLKKRPAP
jgi:hypothetical protein